MGHLTIPGSESYYSQSDSLLGHNQKGRSFFSVPPLFDGFSHKGLSDCEYVLSPTSPLDVKLFRNPGNSYRSSRSLHLGQPKAWECGKVGLSIVDSLDDNDANTNVSGKVLGSSDSKNIVFRVPVRCRTAVFQFHTNSFGAAKSLPRNFAISLHTHTKSPLQKGNADVIFEIEGSPVDPERFGSIRSSSFDSCMPFSILSHFCSEINNLTSDNVDDVTGQVSSPRRGQKSNARETLTLASIPVSSSPGFVGSLSASEIELSEDYTCIISHGPNPKTTHIYGDCILEVHPDVLSDFGKNNTEEAFALSDTLASLMVLSSFPSVDFLSFCYYCNKKLEDGKDIYIYSGEKAFCSLECRSQEIKIDEELEKNIKNTPKSDDGEELSEAGIFDGPYS